MSPTTSPFPVFREAVAAFPDAVHFRHAVTTLLDGGFDRDDLSVLATHQKLIEHEAEESSAAASLPYIAPLAIAGIIAVSAGPIAAAVAALVAAGVGGVAVKEILDRYSAASHRAEIAAAFDEGAVLLWVRCADASIELRALRLLEENGGRHVHIHGHSPDEPARPA